MASAKKETGVVKVFLEMTEHEASFLRALLGKSTGHVKQDDAHRIFQALSDLGLPEAPILVTNVTAMHVYHIEDLREY